MQLKSEVNSPSSDTKLFSQTLYRTSCEIFLDKVIDIKLNPFAEVHLYTFQTNTGIYVADNIVSHNCRCDLILEDVEA